MGGVGHWLFYALGWMDRYHGFLHASIQTQLYLACFIGGFLMTAVPRFSGTSSSQRWELVASAAALAGVATALVFGQWIISEGFYLLWLLFLVRFVAVRFLKRQVLYPPVNFVWVPPAVFLGLAGATIIILVLMDVLGPEWMEMGRSMQEQGFVLALVLGIGGFLGPRLMGIHQLPPSDTKNLRSHLLRNIFFHASAALLLIASFFLEGPAESTIGYALRAAVVTGMFLWTRSLNTKIISGPSLFIRLLSGSFWMIALGYWLIPFFPKLHIALLHLVFLGGFSLMIYCVSTMVILSHAGRGEELQKPLWVLRLVVLGVPLSLILRLLATFLGEYHFLILGISSGIWLAVGAGWLIFSAPLLIRIPKRTG